MSVFVNRNIKGKWIKIEVTDDEVALVEKTNFKKNVAMAARVVKYFPGLLSKQLGEDGKGVSVDKAVMDALIPVFTDKMTTPLHFAIENFVDEKLSKTAESSDL